MARKKFDSLTRPRLRAGEVLYRYPECGQWYVLTQEAADSGGSPMCSVCLLDRVKIVKLVREEKQEEEKARGRRVKAWEDGLVAEAVEEVRRQREKHVAPVPLRTLADVRDAFRDGRIRADSWRLCLDSGGCHLRHISSESEDAPCQLHLPSDPYELLAQACQLAGIPAERA